MPYGYSVLGSLPECNVLGTQVTRECTDGGKRVAQAGRHGKAGILQVTYPEIPFPCHPLWTADI